MKTYIVVVDREAPSFCHYESIESTSGHMSALIFGKVMKRAQEEKAAVHLLLGPSGLSEEHVALIPDDIPVVYFAPLGLHLPYSPTVIVVDSKDDPSEGAFASNNGDIAILKIRREGLAVAEQWALLALSSFRRVVLRPAEDVIFDAATQDKYLQLVRRLSSKLASRKSEDDLVEVNVLTDRIALEESRDCAAGTGHLTIDIDGGTYVCPGLIGQPIMVEENSSLCLERILRRENSPVCSQCDAFGCGRCFYLNWKYTQEANIPPRELCIMRHREREESRKLLDALHSKGTFSHLPPIARLTYEDPFELITRGEDKIEQISRRIRTVLPENAEILGAVTADERDRIRQLFLRRTALRQMLSGMTSETAPQVALLYDRAVEDLATTIAAIDDWWASVDSRYGWSGHNLNIDFKSAVIFRGPDRPGGTASIDSGRLYI